MFNKVMKADRMSALKGRLWKDSEQSFQAKYKSYGSFFYINDNKQSSEYIYIKQWNGNMGMKGNVCVMIHKKSMKLFRKLFLMKGNIKNREKGDKGLRIKCFSSYHEMQDPLD